MAGAHSVTQARSRLPSLIRAAEEGTPVLIQRRDGTVAYVLSRERIEAIVEIMELLANPETMRAIAAHRKQRASLPSAAGSSAKSSRKP